MSKIKHPSEKKLLSLSLDRRNTYGESPHGSRKSIPRGKQRQHRDERRSVNQILSGSRLAEVDDEATEAELAAAVSARVSRLKGFKKVPDSPLDKVISAKRKRRQLKGKRRT